MDTNNDADSEVQRLKEELYRRDEKALAEIQHKHEQRSGCLMLIMVLFVPSIVALIALQAPEVFGNVIGGWFLIIATVIICVNIWRYMESLKDKELTDIERKRYRG